MCRFTVFFVWKKGMGKMEMGKIRCISVAFPVGAKRKDG